LQFACYQLCIAIVYLMFSAHFHCTNIQCTFQIYYTKHEDLCKINIKKMCIYLVDNSFQILRYIYRLIYSFNKTCWTCISFQCKSRIKVCIRINFLMKNSSIQGLNNSVLWCHSALISADWISHHGILH